MAKNGLEKKLMNDSATNALKKSVKLEGGCVMVWDSIYSYEGGPLIRLYCRINAESYMQILWQHVVLNLRFFTNKPAIFMQNNAHVIRPKTYQLFKKENIQLMEKSAQSPNLNPIENIWTYPMRKR